MEAERQRAARRFSGRRWGRLAPVLVGFLLVGCLAGKRESGLDGHAPLEEPTRVTADSLRAQAEAAFSEREDPDRLVEAILLYKRVLQVQPTDRMALVRLARAHYFLADGYLQRDEEKLSRFDRGAFYGEKALSLNPAFAAALAQGKPQVQAISLLESTDLEALYWTAANLGKWSRLKGPTTVMANQSLVKAMLEKVTALDERYFYAATSRYWGAYYAAMPSIAGGDLKRSRQFFDRAIQLAPQYFATRVLMAEILAVRTGDRALFRQQLKFVLDTDPSLEPDIVAEQKVEQSKARQLLLREAELFGGARP